MRAEIATLFGAFAALLPLGTGAQNAPLRAEPAVQLPTYTVSETRLLPRPESWRYAETPGFEILSDGSDRVARGLVRDLLLYKRALEVVWPGSRRNFDIPVTLVLCSSHDRFQEFAPADTPRSSGLVSLTLRDREQAAIVIDLKNSMAPEALDTAAGEPDRMADFSYRVVRDEYLHFLIARADPAPPPWLEAGLTGILASMTFSGDRIEVPGDAVTGDLSARRDLGKKLTAAAADAGHPPAESFADEGDLRSALAAGAAMPLDRMFAGAEDPDSSVWARQCRQFVHLCLFGYHQQMLRPFLEFSLLSSLKPADDETFRQCFAMSARQMLVLLWGYTDFAADQSFAIGRKGGAQPPPIPKPEFREATDAEAGRLKGDILRIGHRVDEAHLALIAPYLRGSRDPQLLASLGLEELAAGNRDRARKFLEAAVAAGTARTRAYLELARLRYEDAIAKPGGAGRLGIDQFKAVAEPLEAARSRPPPLPDVYLLLGDAWSCAAQAPRRENLAVLDEGIMLFPEDTELACLDATLRVRNGFPRDAAAIAAFGLRFAREGPAKDRLQQLAASLSHTAAQAPAR